MILGSTREEFAQLAPLLPGQPTPNLTYIHKEIRLEFQCPVVQTVEHASLSCQVSSSWLTHSCSYRKLGGALTFRYTFGGNFSNISPE